MKARNRWQIVSGPAVGSLGPLRWYPWMLWQRWGGWIYRAVVGARCWLAIHRRSTIPVYNDRDDDFICQHCGRRLP